ncbi:exo-beta-N-acetylmuramidase NamZ family protein [Chitinophaga rhizosphaerae]|uniref:exo-beta-N-acetylmuramidase NamZ family protein n=1 Tax=Chitinophaga rhizosphaerae TaxID=1864947 RepID=UPI000F7FFDE9|nr:DUF1343 domain-containing protein [Chitinophaga rhizosphaerae]
MPDGTDPLTRIAVTSLYGSKLALDQHNLSNLDIVLFDIPDIGCRSYTYLWTMTHVMEACTAHGKQLIIADRPNPLSGSLQLAEGPRLDEPHCSSFIGRWDIPVRHACTFGELTRYLSATRPSLTGLKLDVIHCQHWRRTMFHPEWNPSFVPTSPAIPACESALLYPGLGLQEATNISEGRGTATPFRIAGAPWINGPLLAAHVNEYHPDGVHVRRVNITPAEGKYLGQQCSGIMLHVHNPAVFRPVGLGWLLIRLVQQLHPLISTGRPTLRM